MATAVQGELGGRPVLIVREGTTRRRGKEAQRSNMMAARVIAEVMKTTLGPRGMDKMLVDSLGDITITNDGATILKKIDVQHPAAKMMVEASETQDKEVGDGTTTVVILAGELLKKAEELLDQNIHPTVIVSGYRAAGVKALEILKDVAETVDIENKEILKKIALTSMHSKGVGLAKDHFADIAIDAVKQIAVKKPSEWEADIDNVLTVKKAGESLFDTKLIKGLIVDKEVVHPDMPKQIENAKIALLSAALEIEKTEMDAEIRIRSPLQMKAFMDEETDMLQDMVKKIVASGANVVLCQKGIDEVAQSALAKKGILAARRVKQSDMEKLSKATGAKLITSLEDIKLGDLGKAGIVEERKIGEEKMIFIEECVDPRAVSILIRGGLERMTDEAERAMHDAMSVVSDIIKKNKIVAGGGAVEAEIAKRIRQYASKVKGREQLAIGAFADAIEVVPRSLAENAGLDPIDILVALKTAHEKSDGLWFGVNAYTGKIINMMKEGVIEPVGVKEQAIKSAVEVTSMILRIDDVIAATKHAAPSQMPPQGYGGSGGMPEMPSEF